MSKTQSFFSFGFSLLLLSTGFAPPAKAADNASPYCRTFRLDQVIEASTVREELIEKSLRDKSWDPKKGVVVKSRSVAGSHNKYVFEFLSQNQALKDLLSTCTPSKRISAVEKVRVTELGKLDLPERIKSIGTATSKVPMDAMIFVTP